MGEVIVGLIPARRGPTAKNLRHLGGEPLLTWAVRSAQRAETLHRVVVSSEDDETLQLALSLGADVLRRPAELARDDTPDAPVAAHALESLRIDGWWDILVLLRPTAPFRRAEEIDEVARRLEGWSDVASIRSVGPAPCHPRKCYHEAGFHGVPYRALVPYTPHHAANAPRQGLERVWQAVGFIDAVRVPWVLVGSMEGPLIAAWEAPAERAFDLDSDEDFQRAEALARARGWRPGDIT